MLEAIAISAASLFGGLLLAMGGADTPARWLAGLGAAVGVAAAVIALPQGAAAWPLGFALAGQRVQLHYTSGALWLMGFGLAPAAIAVWVNTPVCTRRSGWIAGATMSMLGAVGVFGLQDGYSLLLAWELMSFGGAVMILSERLSSHPGPSAMFMLALLEVGAVAILLALLLLARHAGGSLAFDGFKSVAPSLSAGAQVWIGVLLLIGFGAKLGLLPFYEWFPGAYATGSGASGAILSGVVLNAAFFALSRGLVNWLPGNGAGIFTLGVLVTAAGALSAVLAVLYALQQDDWRRLLAFSSAENAGIAVTALGACLIFRADGQGLLAGLAWTVAMLHLAGHALAKGGLFVCADGVFTAGGSYRIAQRGWLRRAPWGFGIGALFAAMSLAAIPPQIGFVTEWFTFQTLFQGFQLTTVAGRVTLALAGAGIALTAAVALATFVKAFGIGLLGASDPSDAPRIGARHGFAALVLGLAVAATAVGLPRWLGALDAATFRQFGAHSARAMSHGWLLVPLTDTFAFISPTKLILVTPLLAILPLLLLLNLRRHAVRSARVWYGGMREEAHRAATTSLTFANAMRTFYSFIYRPTLDTAREHRTVVYFIRKVELNHDVADVFGPLVFTPIRRGVSRLARRLGALQSGDLNFYLAMIGALLIGILALSLR